MTIRAHEFSMMGAMLLFGSVVHAESCEQLSGVKLEHGLVTGAHSVPAGSPVTLPGDPIPAANSDYCRIEVTSRPSADSDIRIEVWIPAGAAWNGKFEQVGNGGFAGAVPYRLMSYVMSLGYAVAGTDDGHQSNEMTDARWALNHPEKIKDFGWRAIHDTAVDAKVLLRRVAAHAPAKSYFFGCSDGGREALMMAQRYPTFFDGIIAGAPAYSMTKLLSGGALRTAELGGAIGHLSAPQLMVLQNHALQSCGNGSPFLKDPRNCRVDVASLTCASGNTDSCLTEAQAKTASVIYAERKDPLSGSPLYGVLPGAEAVKGSWDDWLTGADEQGRSAGSGFTWNYLAYMVMRDPNLDIAKVTTADISRGERQFAPIIDSDSADLRAFRAHGGKLIQYHGWNDPGIPPGYSLEYRERLAAKTGGLEDFYRLYMVPGMLHCRGGDAPTTVNWQSTLEAWVEHAKPPGQLVASDGKGGTQTLEPFN